MKAGIAGIKRGGRGDGRPGIKLKNLEGRRGHELSVIRPREREKGGRVDNTQQKRGGEGEKKKKVFPKNRSENKKYAGERGATGSFNIHSSISSQLSSCEAV